MSACMRTAASLLAALSCTVLATSASAAVKWRFQDGGANVTGQSFTSTPLGGPSATVTGWSGNGTIAAANVHMWSGLGVINANESNVTGPHSMDNYGGYDSILFSFGPDSEVSLSSVTLGWNGHDNYTNNGVTYGDSDISVLRYMGSGTPQLAGSSYSGLVSAGGGWEVVGSYGNVGQQSNNTQSLTNQTLAGQVGAKYSSHWLIMAFYDFGSNTVKVNSPGYTTTYPTNSIDAAKILEISGEYRERTPPQNQVPLPGTLALFILGIPVIQLFSKGMPAG